MHSFFSSSSLKHVIECIVELNSEPRCPVTNLEVNITRIAFGQSELKIFAVHITYKSVNI